MSVANLSYGSPPRETEERVYLELCKIKTRLNSMHVGLIRHGKRDGRRLNNLHAETMFIRAQPIDHSGAIRVLLSEDLQLSIRDIVKPLQP
jgi:hypothetical protein